MLLAACLCERLACFAQSILHKAGEELIWTGVLISSDYLARHILTLLRARLSSCISRLGLNPDFLNSSLSLLKL